MPTYEVRDNGCLQFVVCAADKRAEIFFPDDTTQAVCVVLFSRVWPSDSGLLFELERSGQCLFVGSSVFMFRPQGRIENFVCPIEGSLAYPVCWDSERTYFLIPKVQMRTRSRRYEDVASLDGGKFEGVVRVLVDDEPFELCYDPLPRLADKQFIVERNNGTREVCDRDDLFALNHRFGKAIGASRLDDLVYVCRLSTGQFTKTLVE